MMEVRNIPTRTHHQKSLIIKIFPCMMIDNQLPQGFREPKWLLL